MNELNEVPTPSDAVTTLTKRLIMMEDEIVRLLDENEDLKRQRDALRRLRDVQTRIYHSLKVRLKNLCGALEDERAMRLQADSAANALHRLASDPEYVERIARAIDGRPN